MCILLGLVKRWFDINLLTNLLVSNFMSFPDGVHHKILGTHCSFKLAPPLMSPRFDVVSCSGFLVVHVALLCPVQILYLCYQQYLVGSRGGFSSFLGFATAGVPDVRFLTSLMSIRLCA